MRPITLDGFDRKFVDDDDPWSTFTNRDEALKRRAILHAMGPGPWGRVLELAAGNGSNSAAIAERALRLDATEGTASGTTLVARALKGRRRARALKLIVPAALPRLRYDIAVVAEVIYYLSARDMARTARDVATALRPGGMLVLAHHRVDYPDFAQHAPHLQRAFLRVTGRRWQVRVVRRTRRWVVLSCNLRDRRCSDQPLAPDARLCASRRVALLGARTKSAASAEARASGYGHRARALSGRIMDRGVPA